MSEKIIQFFSVEEAYFGLCNSVDQNPENISEFYKSLSFLKEICEIGVTYTQILKANSERLLQYTDEDDELLIEHLNNVRQTAEVVFDVSVFPGSEQKNAECNKVNSMTSYIYMDQNGKGYSTIIEGYCCQPGLFNIH